MHKRHFLVASALAAGISPLQAATPAQPGARTGPGLLTVTGAIARSNRGPLDTALDQLMVKHGAAFHKAWEFDSAMLGESG